MNFFTVLIILAIIYSFVSGGDDKKGRRSQGDDELPEIDLGRRQSEESQGRGVELPHEVMADEVEAAREKLADAAAPGTHNPSPPSAGADATGASGDAAGNGDRLGDDTDEGKSLEHPRHEEHRRSRFAPSESRLERSRLQRKRLEHEGLGDSSDRLGVQETPDALKVTEDAAGDGGAWDDRTAATDADTDAEEEREEEPPAALVRAIRRRGLTRGEALRGLVMRDILGPPRAKEGRMPLRR